MVVHAHYPVGETRVERQAKALVKQGYHVDVICLRGRRDLAVETVAGVQVFRVPVRRVKGRGLFSQLAEYLAFFAMAFFRLALLHGQRRYDVVQVHNLPDFLVFAAAIPKLTGARVILDLHDLMPEFYAGRYGTHLKSWQSRLLHLQERISCWFADHVITVTEPWRKTLMERGIPGDKISVVMNVADEDIFHTCAETGPSTDEDGRFALVYHGNITQRYGLDLVIQALDLVREQIPSIQLIIHGIGSDLQAVMQLTEALKLQDHVVFSTRGMPTAELPRFLKQATVGVVPYRRDVFTDGILPTKLMEYAALGMPVIAARTTAIEAYFDDTMVQFFRAEDAEDLAQSILRLFFDKERRVLLAAGIERFNRKYNWTTVGADYVALVDRLGQRAQDG